MGRPPKFSRTRLQAAALALVDVHGLVGLTMRGLAAELGTGPMTLYNHVADRADLEVLVVEAVLGDAAWPPVPAADWREEVRRVATALWEAVRAHPHVVPLVLTRRTRSPATLGAAEALLAALARSGRSGRRLLIAFRAVSALVTGFAQVELAGPLALAAGEPAAAAIARVRALPRARYPRLREIAAAATRSDAEREFRHGLDLLLAGLSAFEGAIALRRRARRGARHR